MTTPTLKLQELLLIYFIEFIHECPFIATCM